MRFKEVFHTIEEKRRSLPTSNVETLSKYKHDPMMFMSFTRNKFNDKTRGVKLGVNPQSGYDTPIGIYSYPIKAMWDDIRAGEIPFMGELPNIFIFEPKNPDRVAAGSEYERLDFERDLNRLVDILVPIYNTLGPYPNMWRTPPLYEFYASFSNALFNGSLPTKENELKLAEELKKPDRHKVAIKTKLKDMMREIDDDYMETPIQRIWSLTRHVSVELNKYEKYLRAKQTVIWTSILFKLYDGFVDDLGQGFIHKNEPTQAVFFTAAVVDVVDMIHRPALSQAQGHASDNHLLKDPSQHAEILQPLYQYYKGMMAAQKEGNVKKFAEYAEQYVDQIDKTGKVESKFDGHAWDKYRNAKLKISGDIIEYLIKNIHLLPFDTLQKLKEAFSVDIRKYIKALTPQELDKFRPSLIKLISILYKNKDINSFHKDQFIDTIIKVLGQFDESDLSKQRLTPDNYKKFVNNLNDVSIAALKAAATKGPGSGFVFGEVLRNLERPSHINNASNAFMTYVKGNENIKSSDNVFLPSTPWDYSLSESKHFMSELFKIIFKNIPELLLNTSPSENGGSGDGNWPMDNQYRYNHYRFYLKPYVEFLKNFTYGNNKDGIVQYKGEDADELFKHYEDILVNAINKNLHGLINGNIDNDSTRQTKYAEQILLKRLKHKPNEGDGADLLHRLMKYAGRKISADLSVDRLRYGEFANEKLNAYIDRKEKEHKLEKEEEAKKQSK